MQEHTGKRWPGTLLTNVMNKAGALKDYFLIRRRLPANLCCIDDSGHAKRVQGAILDPNRVPFAQAGNGENGSGHDFRNRIVSIR